MTCINTTDILRSTRPDVNKHFFPVSFPLPLQKQLLSENCHDNLSTGTSAGGAGTEGLGVGMKEPDDGGGPAKGSLAAQNQSEC